MLILPAQLSCSLAQAYNIHKSKHSTRYILFSVIMKIRQVRIDLVCVYYGVFEKLTLIVSCNW